MSLSPIHIAWMSWPACLTTIERVARRPATSRTAGAHRERGWHSGHRAERAGVATPATTRDRYGLRNGCRQKPGHPQRKLKARRRHALGVLPTSTGVAPWPASAVTANRSAKTARGARKPRRASMPEPLRPGRKIPVRSTSSVLRQHAQPSADISMSGQRGCTAKLPAGLLGEPDCRRRQPASAIIAPLSVQNSSSG